MSWAIGYDLKWQRDIGYGVPAYCDQPGCGEVIDRGFSYVCGGEPMGGDRGCGLYFCLKHMRYSPRFRQLCARCYPRILSSFPKTDDHPDWVNHKATDPSWAEWRKEQGMAA